MKGYHLLCLDIKHGPDRSHSQIIVAIKFKIKLPYGSENGDHGEGTIFHRMFP